jgi:hypothetical protein
MFATQLPREGQPELVGKNLPLCLGRERSCEGARLVVADVHRHDALHLGGVPGREFVAEDAAPVVQQQRDGPARSDGLNDGTEQGGHVGQGGRTRGLVRVEARQREAHAAVSRLQRLDRAIPQPVGVRPAVDHQYGSRAVTLDEDVDALDSKRGMGHESVGEATRR